MISAGDRCTGIILANALLASESFLSDLLIAAIFALQKNTVRAWCNPSLLHTELRRCE